MLTEAERAERDGAQMRVDIALLKGTVEALIEHGKRTDERLKALEEAIRPKEERPLE